MKKNSTLLISDIGIVTLQVHEAKNFNRVLHDPRRPETLLATVSLGWSEPPIYKTTPSDSVDPPIWNSTSEFLCLDNASTTVVVKIMDGSGKNSTVYGHVSLPLGELLTAQEDEQEWWPLSGCRDGQLRLSADWKPIAMDRSSLYIK